MKSWKDLGGDVNWEDYGGKWGRRAKDGSWYVLDFTNMDEACGKDNEGQPTYVCEVKRFDRATTPTAEVRSALRSSGLKLLFDGKLVQDGDSTVVDSKWKEQTIVEACVSYGLGAPIWSESGNRASWVRANARRYAERCMKDDALLEDRLDRPVNAIGSTAREYGAGDIQSALSRNTSDPTITLMRKISGLPTIADAPMRSMKQSDMLKCTFAIMDMSHYRDDGSCRCDEYAHRKMMIAEWEYTEEQFANIPLRDSEPHTVS